jgi:hypothetical protein
MGGAIISELGGGIIPLQGGGIVPEWGGGFLRNQQLQEKMRRANPTCTTYGRPRTEMRIGSMTAAASNFARPINSKKPEGNRGDVGQAQLCSVSILLMELAKLCCSRAPLDGRCPAQIQPPGPAPQTRQFDPELPFRVGARYGRNAHMSGPSSNRQTGAGI